MLPGMRSKIRVGRPWTCEWQEPAVVQMKPIADEHAQEKWKQVCKVVTGMEGQGRGDTCELMNIAYMSPAAEMEASAAARALAV